jgi:hypothetical protein
MPTFEDEILRRTDGPTTVRTGTVVEQGIYSNNTVGVALEGDLNNYVTIPKLQDYRPRVGEAALVLARGGRMYAVGAMPNTGETRELLSNRLWTYYEPRVTALSGDVHTDLDSGDLGRVEGRYQIVDNTIDVKILFYAKAPNTALTPPGVMCFWLPPDPRSEADVQDYVSPYTFAGGLNEAVGSARTYNGDLATTRYATGICIGVRDTSFLWVYTQTAANGAMTTDYPIDWSAAADPGGASVIMQLRAEILIDPYTEPTSG